jgi:hypothetical protein
MKPSTTLLRQRARRFFHAARLRKTRQSQQRLKPGFEPAVTSNSIIFDQSEFEKLWHQYKVHPLNAVTSSVWNEGPAPQSGIGDVDPRNFRSDNAYAWQSRAGSLAQFALTALWVERSDPHSLLAKTHEIGDFGVECIRLGGRLWSRDLIDSILEINFLMDHLPRGSLETMKILDIGAGYGRLLNRLADVTENDTLFAADGVALSTSICAAYIRQRNQESRISVLSLSGVDAFRDRLDLATNIHSFSEMSLEAVSWWLDWLVDREVKYLFVVPNKPGPSLNDGTDLTPALGQRGFRLSAHRHKYTDPVIAMTALYQADYYLFVRDEQLASF